MNTREQAVGDLAFALGMWIGTHETSTIQEECFVESVLVLAFAAGVPRQEALQPFDLHRKTAERVWEQLVLGQKQ